MIDDRILKLAMDAYHVGDHATPEDAIRAALTAAFKQAEIDEDEAHEIGKQEGYEEAVQDIDIMTGGDGEYRCSTADPERHVPDAAAMKERIRQRLQGNNDAVGNPSPAASELMERALEITDEIMEAFQKFSPPLDKYSIAHIVALALMERDVRASKIALKHAKPHAAAYTRRRMKRPYPVTAQPLALQAIRISREILNKQTDESDSNSS